MCLITVKDDIRCIQQQLTEFHPRDDHHELLHLSLLFCELTAVMIYTFSLLWHSIELDACQRSWLVLRSLTLSLSLHLSHDQSASQQPNRSSSTNCLQLDCNSEAVVSLCTMQQSEGWPWFRHSSESWPKETVLIASHREHAVTSQTVTNPPWLQSLQLLLKQHSEHPHLQLQLIYAMTPNVTVCFCLSVCVQDFWSTCYPLSVITLMVYAVLSCCSLG